MRWCASSRRGGLGTLSRISGSIVDGLAQNRDVRRAEGSGTQAVRPRCKELIGGDVDDGGLIERLASSPAEVGAIETR